MHKAVKCSDKTNLFTLLIFTKFPRLMLHWLQLLHVWFKFRLVSYKNPLLLSAKMVASLIAELITVISYHKGAGLYKTAP